MNYSSIQEDFFRLAERPVESIPILFEWNREYELIFDRQMEEIRNQLVSARQQKKFTVYLSCPISQRGGGARITNVQIADFVKNSIEDQWGSKVWVLNPAEWEVTIEEKLRRPELFLSVEERKIREASMDFEPSGGDYMRMWTKVLVENERNEFTYGSMFDMFYFIGAKDVMAFFYDKFGGDDHLENIGSYYNSAYTNNRAFREELGLNVLDDAGLEARAQEFIRFYGMRGGANYSKGCHDEWNIWVEINRKRMKDGYAVRNSGNPDFQIGSQISGYMNGDQIGIAESETYVEDGYGIRADNIRRTSEGGFYN